MQQEQRSGAPGWLAWLLLALVWFATAPWRPLFDPDEGRYAEIPREMTVSGDWVTPRFNDLKYFEKPPLQYWATAAAYEAFGVHEWSSRLWSTGLAFACLPLVFAWVAWLFDVRRALTALLALGVSPYFALIGHINLLDAAFTFWLTAAVFAFTLAQCAPRAAPAERRWMLIAWAAAALAVLSKGIVVGVLAGRSAGAVHAHRARHGDLAAPARGAGAGAVPADRRALVRAGDAAQPELPGFLLRARALRALPHHRAPARGAVVVLPAAAAGRGAALAAAGRARLPRGLGRARPWRRRRSGCGVSCWSTAR